MSHYYGIGDAAKKLHAKLVDNLAGPLRSLLPRDSIQHALDEIGYRFRRTAFSPLGNALGLPRPSPRSRRLLQPRFGPHPGPPRPTRSPADVG